MKNLTSKHDNRNYDYTSNYSEVRNEYEIILKTISRDAKVIDLGCGDGSLMHLLQKELNAECTGVEISLSGVENGISKGLNIKHGKIDEHLAFEDNQFDYAICNVTIQMVLYPEILFSEMIRISKKQIISFPNFAFYKNRIDLLLKGRMPKPMLFNYDWFNTGHIHQFSINDFLSFVKNYNNMRVVSLDFAQPENSFKKLLSKKYPNLFVPIPIFLLEKLS